MEGILHFQIFTRSDVEDLVKGLYNIVMKRSIKTDQDQDRELKSSSADQDDLDRVLEQIIQIIPMIEMSKLKRIMKPVD